MPKEKFIDIFGFEKLYQINKKGEVFSLLTNKILKGSNNGNGYIQVQLKNKENIYKMKYIHRLVAENFLINSDNSKEVNHKDGHKSNNNLNNLEWCTKSENTIHAIKNKLYTPYKLPKFSTYNHPKSKVTKSEVLEIVKRRDKGEKLKSIAEDFNIGPWQVSKIYKREKHGK